MSIMLSVVIITKNEEDNIVECLESVKWVDEIIVVDDDSEDKTVEIAEEYTRKIYCSNEHNLGVKKNFAISKATGDWILVLDADERVSKELEEEMKETILKSEKVTFNGFFINYQNHFFKKPINFGGENYSKLRLFRRSKGEVTKDPIHEDIKVKGKVGILRNKIIHYSYRSLSQTLHKFEKYAKILAAEKYRKNEESSFKKIIFYPIHMFIARFVKEEGYKDGIYGFLLASLFSYMEFLIYFNLLLLRVKEE